MKKLTLEEFLYMFMVEVEKRHDEHSNLIKELQASTNFTLRNQQTSIKALEIQFRQMSIILHEKLSENLQSSTEIKPRINDETTSTSVETNMPSIRHIDASQYTISNLQNRNLFSNSMKTTLPSTSRLNDDYWDELMETDGEKDLEAHYTNATPLGKALPQIEKEPGSFTLPCLINNITVKRPYEIAKNVIVGIDKFTFPVDFIILDIPEDSKTPLILGRPFLSTAHAIIDDLAEMKFDLNRIFWRMTKVLNSLSNSGVTYEEEAKRRNSGA
ncbi:homeodomain-like protein [Tanacetum coccineum]